MITGVSETSSGSFLAFEGYASVFRQVDQGGDLVERGAFSSSLMARGAEAVRMLFQHDAAEPVGRWLSLIEDDFGLKCRGVLVLGSRRGRDLAALVQAGAINGLSVGFRTHRATRDQGRRVRRLRQVDLWEISLVSFPMQPAATITRVYGPSGNIPPSNGQTLDERVRALARQVAKSSRPNPIEAATGGYR